MPISLVRATDTFIEFDKGGNLLHIEYADIPGNNINARIDNLKAIAQSYLDRRQALADLPGDDPDKTTNPNRPDLFWGRSDGTVHPNPAQNDHLISRPVTLVDLTFDGVRFFPVLMRTEIAAARGLV